MSRIIPQRRQYKISLDPGSFILGVAVAVRRNDAVAATWVSSAGESVAVKMGIVPLPGTSLGVSIVSTVGLAVVPGT